MISIQDADGNGERTVTELLLDVLHARPPRRVSAFVLGVHALRLR
jgi:hypothetical protein